MESNLQYSPSDKADAKNAFRKPSTDAASRNYRRRSPVGGGSSSSDSSPKRGRTPSPLRENPLKVDHHSRREGSKDTDRDSSRSHYGRSSDAYRYSGRQSARVSHGYSRNNDQSRHDKYADEDRNRYSGRDSRDGTHYEHIRQENEYDRKDHGRSVDKYPQDRYEGSGYRSKEKDREQSPMKYKEKSSSYERAGSGRRYSHSDDIERDRVARDRERRDERKASHRSSRDYRSEQAVNYEESKGKRNNLSSKRDSSRHQLKEGYKSDMREKDDLKFTGEEKKQMNDSENKDQYGREPDYQLANESSNSPAKKPKLSNADNSAKDAVIDDRQTNQTQEGKVEGGSQAGVSSDDINAAKVAAMKAAELVNRNLVGSGYMTADQKKKLLWGNKKNTTIEEVPLNVLQSSHRWDTTMFSDKERQDKFNKLMGVKGEVTVEQKPKSPNGDELLRAEKQKELQIDLEKQYTAGLRRRDGRTVGLGL